MRATDVVETDAVDGPEDASFVGRLAVLLYGIGSYGLGVLALVAWILSMLGVLPFTGGGLELAGATAIAFNLALMAAFGIQHSVMARATFKEKWTRIIPPAAERATFVLATGVVLGATIALWQPMPTTIWSVQSPLLSNALIGLQLVGWTYLFLATFAIDHFELFGLRQVYEHFRGRPVTAVPFKERFMYRFDRHPIMTGALIGLWVTPHMELDHLLFATFATIYIVIGVYFEERSLRRQWGKSYDDYAKRVRSLVPTLPR